MSSSSMSRTGLLEIVPLDFDEANALVEQWHRHHKPAPRYKFALGVAADGTVRGAAIVGRPVNTIMCDGWTLEVTRCVTDGTPNACSALYAAAWRVTRNLGYRRLISYIHADEPGTSLIAAGWKLIAKTKPRPWSHASRPRVDKHPLVPRLRFEVSV